MQSLENGIQQLGIRVDATQLKALQQFIQLLLKWNQHFNLTAIDTESEIISKHILDSLSVQPYITGKSIMDIGSGAGLPGIPLAIVCAQKQFLLLDSNAKKTKFIQQAIIELSLKNIQVLQQRVEEFLPSTHFDTLISRAFASGDKLFNAVDHLLSDNQLLVMYGKQNPLQNLPKRYTVIAKHALDIPNLNASRNIAIIEKKND